MPSIPNTLGNFLLPLMIGAPDVAFPRLNLFSWYLTIAAGVLTVYALVAGGVDTGWTFYTPYLTMFSNSHVLAGAAGVFVVGFASIATGVNFIATTHMLRAPGHDLVPAAAVRMGDLRHLHHHGTGHAGAGDFAIARSRSDGWNCPSSIPSMAAIRSCSSICSGSIRTLRSTLWFCPRWAWFRKSSPASRGGASSATTSWSTQ